MRYYVEKDLVDFDFWSGACYNADIAHRFDLFNEIEEYLNGFGPMTETEVNDWFWFDFDEWLEEWHPDIYERLYNSESE